MHYVVGGGPAVRGIRNPANTLAFVLPVSGFVPGCGSSRRTLASRGGVLYIIIDYYIFNLINIIPD